MLLNCFSNLKYSKYELLCIMKMVKSERNQIYFFVILKYFENTSIIFKITNVLINNMNILCKIMKRMLVFYVFPLWLINLLMYGQVFYTLINVSIFRITNNTKKIPKNFIFLNVVFSHSIISEQWIKPVYFIDNDTH